MIRQFVIMDVTNWYQYVKKKEKDDGDRVETRYQVVKISHIKELYQILLGMVDDDYHHSLTSVLINNE